MEEATAAEARLFFFKGRTPLDPLSLFLVHKPSPLSPWLYAAKRPLESTSLSLSPMESLSEPGILLLLPLLLLPPEVLLLLLLLLLSTAALPPPPPLPPLSPPFLKRVHATLKMPTDKTARSALLWRQLRSRSRSRWSYR